MKLKLACALVFAAAFAAPGNATVVIQNHPFASPDPTPQIHSNGTQTGTSVLGHTMPGNFSYTFTSPSTLTTNGNGHAKVEGPWQRLTIAPSNPIYSFTAIDFNLNVSDTNKNNPFFADITVNLVGGGTVTFSNLSLGNGQNKYLIFGNAGEKLASITFTGWANVTHTAQRTFDDIRQVDVDTFSPAPAVPEPATWLMMILGFGFIGSAIRRANYAAFAAN